MKYSDLLKKSHVPVYEPLTSHVRRKQVPEAGACPLPACVKNANSHITPIEGKKEEEVEQEWKWKEEEYACSIQKTCNLYYFNAKLCSKPEAYNERKKEKKVKMIQKGKGRKEENNDRRKHVKLMYAL